ncbi:MULTISPECIES: zinc-binding dehydrogenase [Citrobacter]|uniref:zinc-binding dehydrogenase n=1 Tax=Citrobacter TaxID=544 RepID=UPI000E3DE05B|nr:MULTISPECIES: zinc-binding dehydrogenase [Citrobacter]MBD0826511.1 alcohol dehydrogenase [Citrobacter sp. C1]RFU93248.1 alcohol dehydrogenase [Citrobacter gillenii]
MAEEFDTKENCGDTHRAWTWHGSPEPQALKCEYTDIPVPESDEVLVRNAIIGLNPVDWKVLTPGLTDWKEGHVPGVDGAGTVIAVGNKVDERWLGCRVVYHQNLGKPGSFAEHTPVAARALMRVPDAMTFDIAASVPCPALTAWLAIEKLPASKGARLLISGAGGAVGHYLVQFALSRGFIVTAMCNTRHWLRLESLGVQFCTEGPLPAEQTWTREHTAEFFAVIDSVNKEHAARLTPVLKANGHIVSIQGRVVEWPCPPFGRTLSMHEVALGALHWFGDNDEWRTLTEVGEKILRDLTNGRLVAEKTVSAGFEELPRLLNELRHRQFSGKPLILIN